VDSILVVAMATIHEFTLNLTKQNVLASRSMRAGRPRSQPSETQFHYELNQSRVIAGRHDAAEVAGISNNLSGAGAD
jgi:hypothetical protein